MYLIGIAVSGIGDTFSFEHSQGFLGSGSSSCGLLPLASGEILDGEGKGLLPLSR